MSTRKRITILAALTVLVMGFTVWNVTDFCKDDSRTTIDYFALMVNMLGIRELGGLIWKEVKRR